MAIQDSKRLNMVMLHLYPNLKNVNIDHNGDYRLDNYSDGTGTHLTWLSEAVPEPTAQQLEDAKEDSVNAYWFRKLRMLRDRKLVESDWSQSADVPSSIKDAYVTYRAELRDLPATVTKPSFSTLNGQEVPEWDIPSYMPTKPS